MQVLCDEGIANHIGPKPCAGIREGVGECMVTGVSARCGTNDSRGPGIEKSTGIRR